MYIERALKRCSSGGGGVSTPVVTQLLVAAPARIVQAKVSLSLGLILFLNTGTK